MSHEVKPTTQPIGCPVQGMDMADCPERLARKVKGCCDRVSIAIRSAMPEILSMRPRPSVLTTFSRKR